MKVFIHWGERERERRRYLWEMNTSGEQKHNGLEERMQKEWERILICIPTHLKWFINGKTFWVRRAHDKKTTYQRVFISFFDWSYLGSAANCYKGIENIRTVQALDFRREAHIVGYTMVSDVHTHTHTHYISVRHTSTRKSRRISSSDTSGLRCVTPVRLQLCLSSCDLWPLPSDPVW